MAIEKTILMGTLGKDLGEGKRQQGEQRKMLHSINISKKIHKKEKQNKKEKKNNS